jgi:hypothetical protein
MLARYGLILDETSTKTERMNAVMKFGTAGMAEATAETRTAAGAWRQFKNEMGETAESAEGLVSGLGKILAAMNDVSRAHRAWTQPDLAAREKALKEAGFSVAEKPDMNQGLPVATSLNMGDIDKINRFLASAEALTGKSGEMMAALRQERDMIGLTADARQQAIQVMEFEKQARQDLKGETTSAVKQYAEELKYVSMLRIEEEKLAGARGKTAEYISGQMGQAQVAGMPAEGRASQQRWNEAQRLASQENAVLGEQELYQLREIDRLYETANAELNRKEGLVKDYLESLKQELSWTKEGVEVAERQRAKQELIKLAKEEGRAVTEAELLKVEELVGERQMLLAAEKDSTAEAEKQVRLIEQATASYASYRQAVDRANAKDASSQWKASFGEQKGDIQFQKEQMYRTPKEQQLAAAVHAAEQDKARYGRQEIQTNEELNARSRIAMTTPGVSSSDLAALKADVAAREKRNAALKAGVSLSAQEHAELAASIGELQKAGQLREVADSIGEGFGRAFEKIIFDCHSLEDAMEGVADIAREVLQEIIRITVIRPMAASIAGGIMGGFFEKGGVLDRGQELAFARGGALNRGEVTPFASGGLLTRPTIFPMAKGYGLAGENGPEAIMPLRRGPGGRLGVESGGGGGQDVNVKLEQEIVVNNQTGSNIKVTRDLSESDVRRIVLNITSEDVSKGGSLWHSISNRIDTRR